MDLGTEIVFALSKLGFTFWQIVVMVALFMFKGELRELMSRVASLKLGGSEIVLTPPSDAASALQGLKSQIQVDPVANKEVIRLIDKRLKNLQTVALVNLKKKTSYLWPALLKSKKGESVCARVRQQTLDMVTTDLKELSDSGLLSYEVVFGPKTVHEIYVKNISSDLKSLIDVVNREY